MVKVKKTFLMKVVRDYNNHYMFTIKPSEDIGVFYIDNKYEPVLSSVLRSEIVRRVACGNVVIVGSCNFTFEIELNEEVD